MRSSKKTFQILSTKPGFRGKLVHLDVLQIETRSGRRVEREVIKHPGAVVVIPKLPHGNLVLIYQLRAAVGGEIWEFPAGTLEKGESIQHCAQRELEEETGYRAGRIRRVLDFFPTPGISTEKMYLFVAEDLKEGKSNLDSDEELEAREFSEAEVERMIRQGKIIDGKTILGFLFYQKYKV